MESGNPLFLVADDLALALGAGNDPVDRLFELLHAYPVEVGAGGEDGAFVQQVFKIGAGEARCLLGQHHQVDVLFERLAFGVDAQDGLAAANVGPVQDDLAIEATRAQQRRVEDVGAVGGGQDNHVGFTIEAVHLDQDLV